MSNKPSGKLSLSFRGKKFEINGDITTTKMECLPVTFEITMGQDRIDWLKKIQPFELEGETAETGKFTASGCMIRDVTAKGKLFTVTIKGEVPAHAVQKFDRQNPEN